MTETGMSSSSCKKELRFPLDGTRISLGRDQSSTVPLQGLGISRKHAEIDLGPSEAIIIDSGSTFGLRVNGIPVERHTLTSGDVITIGIREFKIDLRNDFLVLEPVSEETEPHAVDLKDSSGQAADASYGGEGEKRAGIIRIGRDPTAELPLLHPLVSRFHASVTHEADGTLQITDNHSANGTFVNGKPVTRCALSEADIVQIGPYRLFVEQGRLVKAEDSNRIKLEAFGITVRIKKNLLIDRVTITVPAGEFVAVLGVSGAGKSTLVRALCGRQRIESGQVFANRLPLKQFLGAFTSNIGYVSQDNLLHSELTVAETFREQSLIRLPRDSSALEHASRIDEVITLLELEKVRNRRISRLSGGEAKRVHLGIELLASPALIVLDEPLAGLDPGLVRKFMQLFRRICDRGHSILMTTHTLEQIEFCDRLIFMHRGRIVFTGQPSELEPTFGSASLADVYEAVAAGKGPLALGRPPVEEKSAPVPGGTAAIAAVRVRKPRSIQLIRQFSMLVSRYTRIMVRDRRNLLLLLLQAPAIAIFLAFVFKSESKFLPMSFYFCLTISAIWMSGINAAQEIAREWLLLDREYRVGLSLKAYLVAKAIVTAQSALVQATLFWLFLGLTFATFPFSLTTWFLIAVGTASGGVLGLCISALSGNVSRAITVLPIIFIPQIFFSGILIPFDRMTEIGRILSYCTFSRPVFSLFKHTCLLEQPLFESDAWPSLCFLILGLIILISGAVWWNLARIKQIR